MARSSTSTPIHPLERRVLAHLRATRLIPPGGRGVVCVSGGGDSVGLLRILHALRERLGVDLEVLHFDHGLRPEAAQEAAWVGALAGTLGLRFHLRATGHLAALGAGVQAAASAWRRAECARLVREQGLAWAATAHQRDDHLESLLLGLLRGSHIANFRGIAAWSPPYVRPLLPFGHGALLEYLRDLGQPWLEDPSNRSGAYLRNRVRHELLPLMDELGGSALGRRLDALAAQSREVAELLQAFPHPRMSDPAAPVHWIDAAELAALPRMVMTQRLAQFVQARLPGALRYDQLETAAELLAAGAQEWTVHLARGRRLRRLGARVLLESLRDAPGDGQELRVNGFRVLAPRGTVLAPRPPTDAQAPGAQGLTLYNLPPGAELVLRTPLPGDRVRAPGHARATKLGAFLRGQGLTLSERRRTPVVAWEGRVVAVHPRFVDSAHAAPRDPGQPVLHLIIEQWPG